MLGNKTILITEGARTLVVECDAVGPAGSEASTASLGPSGQETAPRCPQGSKSRSLGKALVVNRATALLLTACDPTPFTGSSFTL